MKAIGGVRSVAGTHFEERSSLLASLHAMIAAPSFDHALPAGCSESGSTSQALRVSLPADLRHAMLPDLPPDISLEPGRLEIRAETEEGMLDNLVALAMVMTRDLKRSRDVIVPPPQPTRTVGSQRFFEQLRGHGGA